MNDSHVYLIGFMGAGKTTIGRILSTKLARPFIDTDDAVQAFAGESILDIFAHGGETAFRDMESQVIQNISNEPPAVVALGGGAVVDPENWTIIMKSGTVVYLSWKIEILLKRIAQDSARPLVPLYGLDGLRDLFAKREPLYQRAEVVSHCDHKHSPEFIADKIVKLVRRNSG